MEYLDFKLSVEHDSAQTYKISANSKEGGQTHELSDFPYEPAALQQKLKKISDVLRTTGVRAMGRRKPTESPAEKDLTAEDFEQFGDALFSFLFPGETLAHLRRVIDAAFKVKDQGVRLQLRFAENAAVLATIPWEFLRDSAKRDFVVLDNRTSLVRYIDLALPIEPLSTSGPLKVLGMVSNPIKDLDVEKEKNRIEESVRELQADGRIQLTWLEGDTVEVLQDAIRNGDWDVFHYIGHGDFDDTYQEGTLQLSDGLGGVVNLFARSLGRLLRPEKLKLVVLNSCRGASASDADLFSSTAATLLNDGILAALAMQYPITDAAAIELARTFYGAIADGVSVDYALADARNIISLKYPDSAEWATPVLYMRSSNGRLMEPKAKPEPETPVVVNTPRTPEGWDETNVLKVPKKKFKDVLEGFTIEELKNFADDLEVPYESLPAQTRDAVAREMIGWLQRRKRLGELIDLVNEEGREQIYAVLDHLGPVEM